MLIVFGIMVVGVGVGIGVRSIPHFRHVGKWISIVIYFLLFLLGREVGTNAQLLSSLSTLGIQALLITTGALIGSIFCAWALYKFFFQKHEG
ncbi:LysO family transporter [Sphingobacterium yanglingense]|uniref:Lysine exporter LysO-like protein n=1 Tax=Sphingobacterium yanglingense TaxID=1437280 RepID=A0A4R6WCR3_9SPHI|nr:LysO family transporter [Sphingobacterium yanglingense]TDQ77388.1 lysine exporter LysO-like protein [Sphingobacterium yanglingense]